MRSQILRLSVVALGVLAGGALTADSPTVTFHKDVEPVLQKHCQTCHRPGQVAPMSFMTYDAVRPYARNDIGATCPGRWHVWQCF